MNDIQQELGTLCEELDEYYVYSLRSVTGGDRKLTGQEYKRARALHDSIAAKIGAFKNVITSASGIPQAGQEDIWIHALSYSHSSHTVASLNIVIQAAKIALGRVESDIKMGKRPVQTGEPLDESGATKSEPPKAFIVHGGETRARNKLQKFLIALGVQPLIIEEEPKEGRSVDQQVEHYSEMADCAILLGTADDKELKDGKLYPRRNDFIEVGRFLERFPRRIIYLQEEGASFPSIIAEKLRTPFTQDNMDEAFVVIARELRAFGILRMATPKNWHQS